MLKDNEILQCTSDMGIPLTESELKQPNFQVLRTVFTNAAESLMGVTADELNQPKFEGLDELSYPDLHEVSVPRLNLFRISTRLLETCGCLDFSLPDLFKPTYQKLRIYLSAIINFAKFREDQLDVYAQKTELQEQLAIQLDEKSQVIDDLTKQIEEINSQQEKDMPVIIELQEQKKSLKNALTERGAMQVKVVAEKDQLKAEENAVKAKIPEVENEILRLQSDNSSLAEKVVKSPDRLQSELNELDRRFEDETSQLKSLQEKKQNDAAQERMRLDTIKQLKKTMEHMRSLEKQQKKYKEATKQLKNHKSTISQLTAAITEQEALHEHYVHRSETCGKRQEAVDEQSADRTQIEVRPMFTRLMVDVSIAFFAFSNALAGSCRL
mgnify:CR=1 FL=1